MRWLINESRGRAGRCMHAFECRALQVCAATTVNSLVRWIEHETKRRACDATCMMRSFLVDSYVCLFVVFLETRPAILFLKMMCGL